MALVDCTGFVRLLAQLTEVGAHAHIDVPSVVVIGDQSAGKSSLIQRICGVDLPRSAGTCTRCPMEVRLIAAGEWSCTLKIRSEWDLAGGKLSKVEERQFGSVLTERDGVEHTIRRTQKAVLNPSTPAKDFEEYQFKDSEIEEAASNELKFSKNLVVLEVRGVPYSLTLIDLPGIISATEREEDKPMIELIKDLVTGYIGTPRAIIVTAISCINDIENQVAIQMAKEADPRLQRTLGVLTKPDRIEPGCHKRWLSILRGDSFPLHLGYFMVRNSTQTELSSRISHEAANKAETDFFTGSEMLRTAWEIDGHRLGVQNLVKELSALLETMVKEQLPGMKKTVDEQLKQLRSELSTFPAAVNAKERAGLLHRTLRALSKDAEQLVQSGTGSSKGFIQRTRALYTDLASAVSHTRPRFVLHQAPSFSTTIPEFGPKKLIASYGEADAEADCKLHEIAIHEVKDMIASERSIELPGFCPYPALIAVVKRFQGLWEEHGLSCLEKNAELLQGALLTLASMHFGRFRASKLEAHIRTCIEELGQAHLAQARDFIDLLLEMEGCEKSGPFTVNTHYYTDSFDKILDGMKAQLQKKKMEGQDAQLVDEHLKKALSSLAMIGVKNLTPEGLLGKVQDASSEIEEELTIIAATMAYFKVASKRYVDYVSMAISTLLHDRVVNGLEDHIERHLRKLAAGHPEGQADVATEDGGKPWQESETVLSLVQDDPQLAKKRSLLEAKHDSLRSTRKILMQFV